MQSLQTDEMTACTAEDEYKKPQSEIGNADLIGQLPLIANELKATKIILR